MIGPRGYQYKGPILFQPRSFFRDMDVRNKLLTAPGFTLRIVKPGKPA